VPAERYHVVLVVPPENPFAEGLREVAETLVYGLRHSGRQAGLAVNGVDRGAVNIVLNSHLLGEDASQSLPPDTILYNFEQVHGDSEWMKPIYVGLVRRHVTWDYSRRNVAAWQRYVPDARVLHVPLGYAPELTRIAGGADDVDVLFYGSMNERRERVLEALEDKGVRVVNAYGKFGPERDALIARAKLVLNMHFYESKVFEMPRVAYLLANRKAMVCEVDGDTDIEDDLRDAVAGVPRDELVDRCVALLGDAAARQRLAERGFALFRSREQARILDDALGARVLAGHPEAAALPARLNAGSGKGWRIDSLNVDIDRKWRPDLVADLGTLLPAAEPVDLGRYGRRPLPAGHFEEIHASHVLEHIPDLVTAMTSLLALLREGGTLHTEVPYDLSYGAWQDPTHVRAMNERSWLYYTEWFWYLGWQEHRFEMVELRYILSELGRKLTENGMPAEDVLRQPRAVDAMRTTLRKVRLTDGERVRAANRWA
jgi:SAM-dependent methyltransferase